MNHDTPRLRRGVFSYWDAKIRLLKRTCCSSRTSTPARLPEHRQKKTDDQPGEEHQNQKEREELAPPQGSAGDRRAAPGIGDVKAVPGDEESEAWNEEQEQPSQDELRQRGGGLRAERGITFHERIPSGPDVRAVQCRWSHERWWPGRHQAVAQPPHALLQSSICNRGVIPKTRTASG